MRIKIKILIATVTFSATAVTALAIENNAPKKTHERNSEMVVAANDNGQKSIQKASLYTRLGGYDAIAAVINETMPKLISDPKLGRFWANRGEDGIKREKQFVIDFIANQAGGPVNYGGRDMVTTHKGMKIDQEDWKIFMRHLNGTLEKFKVPAQEKTDVVNFMESLKETMVE
jgi:hemoglobin